MTKTAVVKTFEIIISALSSDTVDCDNESFIPTCLENATLGKAELAYRLQKSKMATDGSKVHSAI